MHKENHAVPNWIAACAVDDVDLEDVMPLRHGGLDYAVYRSPAGEFYVTAGHCSHERQLLCDGLVMGSVIECPKHNGRFDYRTGRALSAPAIEDLPTYPVRVADDTVYVDLPDGAG
jgi:3-phenylpropionate/trans-cinnamate dioxygenase ferredoxin component